MKPKFLGICGGTGSGKTYLANKILELWGQGNVAIINQDSYYKDLSHMDYKNRIKQNFDPQGILNPGKLLLAGA